ncbi:MAG: PilZ domain-containing protein [Desulfobacterales bacterium]
MPKKYKRSSTRSQVWPDTQAIVTATDPLSPSGRGAIKIDGNVKDIGSLGMFLITKEYLPNNDDVEIEIIFDPDSQVSNLNLRATGKTVHRTHEGIGIKFTSIDLSRLQKCIVEKMNREERAANSMYTLGDRSSKARRQKN